MTEFQEQHLGGRTLGFSRDDDCLICDSAVTGALEWPVTFPHNPRSMNGTIGGLGVAGLAFFTCIHHAHADGEQARDGSQPIAQAATDVRPTPNPVVAPSENASASDSVSNNLEPAASPSDAATNVPAEPGQEPEPAPVADAAPAEPEPASDTSTPTAPTALEPQAVLPSDSDLVAALPLEPTSRFEPKLRLITGFKYQTDDLSNDAEYGFVAQQVRAGMKLAFGKHLTVKASFELTDGIDPGPGVNYLRTAVIQYKPSKKLRLSAGRFKRPFSRLELIGLGELPITNRGLLNEIVVEDAAWGDRALGVQAAGRIKSANLRWTLAVTNPQPDYLRNQGIDTIARLEWRPVKALRVGLDGGNKYVDFERGRQHFQAVGMDVRWRASGLDCLVEGLFADRPWSGAVAYGATALVTYTFPLTTALALQPVLFGEYADANLEYSRNESFKVLAGANLLILKRLRVMPHVALTRPVGEPILSAPPSSDQFAAINPWPKETRWALLLSLEL